MKNAVKLVPLVPQEPSIKIEDGIPISPKLYKSKYPFGNLAVSQSFWISSEKYARVANAAAIWKKKNPGWDYAIRRVEGGVRVWRLTAIILAALVATTPAFAWTNTNNGSNNQIVDGGPGAQANAKAQAGATARAGVKATQSQSNHVKASGGASNASNSVTVLGAGGGTSGGGIGAFAGIGMGANPGASGADCPTVSFGLGGLLPTGLSSKCDKRRTADFLANLYGPGVAQAYAEANIDGVKEAVAATKQTWSHPAWCVTNKGIWLRDLPECGEDPR